MSWQLRGLLIVGSVLTEFFVLRKVRKSKMQTEDSIFWLFFSSVLVLIGIFPNIASFLSRIIGVQSPANLVFLSVIFMLIIRLFAVDQRVSKLNHQIAQTIQSIAIEKTENRERQDQQ